VTTTANNLPIFDRLGELNKNSRNLWQPHLVRKRHGCRFAVGLQI